MLASNDDGSLNVRGIEYLFHRPYISAISTLLIIICITNWLSTWFFNASANGRKGVRQPPTAPYSVLGLYHALGFVINGPSKFFTITLNKYGRDSPFLVRAGPVKFAVVSEPAHVRSVFQSREMSVKPLQVQIFEKMFAAPQKALQFYAKDQSQFPEEQRIEYAHATLPRKYFNGAQLSTLSDRYLMLLRRNLAAIQFKEGNWVEIQGLLSYFQRLITRTTTEAIYGSKFLELCPGLVADFWMFDRSLELFSSGTPRFMAKDAYEARDRLLQRFQEWDELLLKNEQALDDEADWNEWGSKFIRVRQKAYLKMEDLDSEGRASEALGLLQGANSNLVPSVFWTLFEVLRNPSLNTRVTKELTKHIKEMSGQIDISKLGFSPLLQSHYAEVLRLRLGTATARTVAGGNVKLDDQYELRKGTTAMIFNHPLGINENLWSKARPDAVLKPLGDFWSDRFLTRDGKFSVEGIAGCWVPFGGGPHLCPGRHFAKNIAILTLAVMLGEHETELVEPEMIEELLPEEIGLSYGIIYPRGEVPVRLRSRKAL